ncbi:hypothetical protein [Saccharothrix sp.]|uniref:hypothetical protein n=1 Tax=Saccharothrix sp. TaxID=1873460 RepID=UPI0028120393|nr:hypothetical protein [Saccharothrix sp.]
MAVLVAILRTTLGSRGLPTDSMVTAHGIGYYCRAPSRPTHPASGARIGYGHAERLPPGEQGAAE